MGLPWTGTRGRSSSPDRRGRAAAPSREPRRADRLRRPRDRAGERARTGRVGFLRIVDRDYVEWSNLQRQVLFDEQDARDGAPKATAAVEQLQRVNSEIQYEAVVEDFGPENAERIVGDVDLALDGTDNLDTRYVLNDVCVKLGKPWVYLAAVASYGVLMPIVPGETACLRCVFAEQPDPGSIDTCDTAGVLGPMPGIVANLAAAEALKLLIGAHERLNRGLTWIDCWFNTIQQTPIESRRPRLPVLSGAPVPVPGATGLEAGGHPVRARRRPGPPGSAGRPRPRRPRRPSDGGGHRPAGAASRQAERAAPRADDLPRRPRDRQGHLRDPPRPEPLRPLRRHLTASLATRGPWTEVHVYHSVVATRLTRDCLRVP